MSKPRPPKFNRENIQSRKSLKSLVSLTERYLQFEKLREKGEVTTSFIAFEALCSILGATNEGFSEEEILDACPDAWGQETVQIPAGLLLALTGCWQIYKDGPSGQTLGEAFGIEGGGQGKKPARIAQSIRDKRRRLAADVEIEYVTAHLSGGAIIQTDAIQNVAEEQGVTFSTVEAAYKEYKAEIRAAMKKHKMIDPEG